MKQLFAILATFITLLSNAQSEHILSFHSDIRVDTTTTISVKETIKVYASGNAIKRGITRALPTERNINNKKEKVKYDILSVKKDNEQEDFRTEKTSTDIIIYIGKSDVFLSSGEYTYEINYTATNQIGFFDEYDELYWNVNGTQSSFRVDEVSANVVLPETAKILQQSCYTGAYNSSAQNCTFEKTSDNTIAWKAQNLNPYEGLTIAVGFTKGVIAKPPPPPPPSAMQRYGLFIITLFSLLGLIGYYYFTWQKYGIDPPKPTVYPQFNVPENLSPASVGMIDQEIYSGKFLTAGIVNLAIKGYLHIQQNQTKTLGIFTNTAFVLKKLKPADDDLPVEEKMIMINLFANGDTISIDGKYNESIAAAVEAFKANVEYKHKPLLTKGNNTNMLILPGLTIILIFIICLGFTAYFAEPEQKIFIWIAGSGLLTFSIIMFFLMQFLFKFSWFKWVFGILSLFVIVVFIGAMFLDTHVVQHGNYYVSVGFLIVSFILICMYQYFVKRPSEEKLRIQSLIEGFRMYMGAAEEKQIQHFNPPQMTTQVFEKLLPFAMVLGVDKIWGKKFEDMLKNTAMGQTYTSTWYNGPSYTPIMLGSMFGSTFANSVNSTASQPSSSGSGSFGGGFSGGGGGGGGVGGW